MSQSVLPGDGRDDLRCCRGLVTELLLRERDELVVEARRMQPTPAVAV